MLNKKYRNESARLKNWDYRSAGMYFITICTKYMEEVFGSVKNGKMILSEIGKTVDKYWYDIPHHFPFAKLDEYIVMPNHIHGIIIISVETLHATSLHRNVYLKTMKTTVESTILVDVNHRMSEISPKRGSISVIIRSYKSICTKTVNKECDPGKFIWQPRFYDRIIRSEKELFRIRKYIKNNPAKWKLKSE